MDFMIGINTSAPDMMSISVSGPSIFGAEVSTMKQRAAQRRVSVMHCALLRGFRIVFKR